ncbi:MAG TPA: TIM44-like domain-containing protein [Flavobacteriales bacterium]|nr:TIM44-like domain-containing protein [Flavobacteriales bacterium]
MSRYSLYKVLTVACMVFISLQCIARSGGGGGDFSSSDSDAGAIIEIALWLLYLIPFPYNFIAIGVLILVCLLGARKYKQSSSLNTIEKVNSGFASTTQLASKMALLSDFNEAVFIEKSKLAFNEVQRAWEKKNMSPVRKYISDGVYQRFNTQIIMMNHLEQTNTISHLKLLETKIALIELEDPYEIIHVQYKAEITDSFVSAKYSGINQKFNEEFIEFWTYIRKKGDKHNDLYQNNNCPNCGDALPEMGEVSKCPSCQTYTNTGEFDWILCEITQPEEFIDFVNNMSQKTYLQNRLEEYKAKNLETNTQFLEDKASNAYLQVRVAHAVKDMSRICRFSTKEFFESVQNMEHEPYLFNRIFLRDVSMVNILENDTHYFAAFSIQCKEQKVIIRKGELQKMDQALIGVNNILVMTLAKNNQMGKHSVLAHNCSQCGGPVGDTIVLNCQYCGNQLNDEKKDWVVCGLMSRDEYASYKEQFTTRMVPDKKEEKFIEIDMHARDFAINNMMVVMMADGSLGDEEREFAIKVAKKLGFNSNKISALWEHTSANKLGIMMPDDKKSQQKVYKYMKKAAKIDGVISEPEQNILDDVKARYELVDN